MSVLSYMLQDKRRQLTMTVEDVAEETSLSVGSIRAYEQGHRVPSAASFKRLLNCLGLDESGTWLGTTVWKANDGVVYNLSPFAGGHKRRNEESVIVTSVVDDLRLVIIKQVLGADYETLEIINSHLKTPKVS